MNYLLSFVMALLHFISFNCLALLFAQFCDGRIRLVKLLNVFKWNRRGSADGNVANNRDMQLRTF